MLTSAFIFKAVVVCVIMCLSVMLVTKLLSYLKIPKAMNMFHSELDILKK